MMATLGGLPIMPPCIWQPGISHHDLMAYDGLQRYDGVAQHGWWRLPRSVATRCGESTRGTRAATTTSNGEPHARRVSTGRGHAGDIEGSSCCHRPPGWSPQVNGEPDDPRKNHAGPQS